MSTHASRITLPLDAVVEWGRMSKALSRSAASKDRHAPTATLAAYWKRTSPDVLTMTATDRYLAIESAIRVPDVSHLGDLDGVLIALHRDVATLLSLTASERHTIGSVTLRWEGMHLSRSDKDVSIELIPTPPGPEITRAVPSFFPTSERREPLNSPIIATSNLSTIAAMLPDDIDVAMESATVAGRGPKSPRMMWRWQTEHTRSRLIAMGIAPSV